MPQKRLAIVGFAFRFPGPAGAGFWQALCEGRNLVGSVDPSRWSIGEYLHPRESEPGASYTFAGGSLGDVSGFDAAFFGISPREAAQIDPQQRLLLELAWEALESGGIRPSSVRGSRCGAFIGFSGSDYSYRRADDLASVDAFTMTGNTASIAANRISYALDLRGPSMAVDTACSSSLVALHQACLSLAAGESELALAGAVNLHLHPLAYIAFSKAGMLSKSGASRAFDAAGDGYVRSEGGAVVVLKPLERALADGNRVFAVIAGSGVNSDGRTQGLTVPSAQAQAALLTEVYARAGIAPSEIDYMEAHGTGTPVGDPIEARALGEALGRRRAADAPLPIGSVKSNLGHLETAAGMAGLVKAIYCLRERRLPPSINFDTPNPRIAFDEWNLRVVTECTPLAPGKRLVVGINSFGFGGANAHVVLESFPEPQPPAAHGEERPVPLLVSGRSEAALRAAAGSMARWLRERGDLALHDLAWSAAIHRDWHEHRAIAYAPGRAAAAGALETFAAAGRAPGVTAARALPEGAAPVFIYSGNGAQWAGMGRRLLAAEPAVRRAVEEVDALFRRHAPLSVLETLEREPQASSLDATEVAQPLLFAVQVGITAALRAWGVVPAAVAGHSVGEIAAAWACGALTLEQAVRVVFERSRWQGTTRGAGGMTAVALPPQTLRALLDSIEQGARLTLAAFNSPSSVTVAGTRADLEAMEAALAADGAGYRRLALDYAFHGPAMEAIRSAVEASLAGLSPAMAAIPFHSTVAGAPLAGERLDAAYWWRNIREPVQFERAVGALIGAGQRLFVEVGPHPVLRGYLNECLVRAQANGRVLQTMSRTEDGADTLRARAFEAHLAGSPERLASLFAQPGRCVELPTYPWQRERHWYSVTGEGLDLVNRRTVHPLLGHRMRPDEDVWQSQLDLVRAPLYADHRAGGDAVFPAAGFVELALACAAERYPDVPLREIEDLEIRSPMLLDDRQASSVRSALDSTGKLAIQSRERLSGDAWRLHAVARLPAPASAAEPVGRFETAVPRGALGAAEHYRLAASVGLGYGPAFQAVACAWVEPGGDAACAELVMPAALNAEAARAQLHPPYLDGCFQLLVHLFGGEAQSAAGVAFVPVRIGRLTLLRAHQHAAFARLALRGRGPRSAIADCTLYGADREAIALLRGVRFRAVALREPASAGVTLLEERAIPMPAGGARAIAQLPPLSLLGDACASVLHADARRANRREYYERLEPLLEAAFCAFAAEAVRTAPPGPLAPEGEALRARLAAIAGDDELPPAADLWCQLLGDFPDSAREILWLARVGANLAGALRGTTPAASLLPQADDACAEAWSAAAMPCAVDFARAIASLMAQSLRALPSGRRLRILALDSPGVLSHARVAAALDPDRCDLVIRPAAEPATASNAAFDIVLAEDALAPADQAALARLRAQMADGALLVLLERRPSRAVALAIEALQGEAADAGPGLAARPRATEDWRSLLAEHGLALEAVIGDLPDLDTGPRLLLARAEAADAILPAPEDPAVDRPGGWLLYADRSGASARVAARLAAQLRKLGCSVQLLHQPGGVAPIAWEDVLKSVRGECGEIRGVVHLAGLRAPLERQAARCESLAGLLEACGALGMAPDCWLVTRRSHEHPDEALAWGFGRSAINEYPQVPLRLVDLSFRGSAQAARSLAATLLHPDAEDEILLSDNGRQVLRLDASPASAPAATTAFAVPGAAASGEAAVDTMLRLELQQPGLPRSLAWTRHPRAAPGPGEVEIEVRAAGLNFRDVMFAVGQLPDEALEGGFAGSTLGMELAGVVRALGPGACAPGEDPLAPGDEVIAFAPAAFGTHVITRATAVERKPAGWSFEAAAGVPIAFFTAYYALHHLARLGRGERVLIHGAAGGVGLAAVQLAQLAGAEIYASAGSPARRDVLRLLGVEHVLDSRALAFDGEVLALTGGEGVDVVLNSLSGEAMLRSLGLLRPMGRFLELGKRDFYENTRIGLRPMRSNIAYHGIDADRLMLERPAFTRALMQELMALFADGRLKPLPIRAYAADEAAEAFRCMQQSRHTGKIVLSLDPPPAPQRDAARSAAPGAAALRLPAEASYLVTGGLRGFGLATACWLAANGARHLVLVGRSGAADAEARAALAALAAKGVQVRAAACDVADRAALRGLLAEMGASMPPLRGVVHAAAVIDDALVRDTTRERLEAVLAPKARGAANLDELTRGLPLDFFVLFSSATTCFGNPGQASYVAANRYLEVLARERRSAGLPALAVGWGPIADAGFLARNPATRERLEARFGGSALPAAQALELLGLLLAQDCSGRAVVRFDRGLPRMLAAARGRKYERLGAQLGHASDGAAGEADLRRLAEELDDAALAGVLAGMVKTEIGAILRLAPEKLDAQESLADLGLDSLMGVELMAAVQARFGVDIPVMAMAEVGTIERLVARILRELRRTQDGATAQPAPEPAIEAHARIVAAQHAPEIDSSQVDAFVAGLKGDAR